MEIMDIPIIARDYLPSPERQVRSVRAANVVHQCLSQTVTVLMTMVAVVVVTPDALLP
ncbi:hypothetical protein ZHAS_00012916 [Anopheles sinensis]|uniref:Uncharacterized protein n=1 Tax=Anopheles sinensis TaxID=74873 RepID=A0A084W437_ANOSI|nr:hypothetical protein ZHAS_00012916 [Anopheles sinensis]